MAVKSVVLAGALLLPSGQVLAGEQELATDLIEGIMSPVRTMFCAHADPAITLLGNLINGTYVQKDHVPGCEVLTRKVRVVEVHSVQRDNRNTYEWKLASVEFPDGRVGYIVTTLTILPGIEV